MTVIETFVGNRSPSLTDQITVNGVGFDLDGSTVKLRMRPEGGSTLKIDAAATIVDEASGQIQYDWQAADVDTAGRYQAWWSVTLPSGLVQDSPEFPVVIRSHAGASSQINIVTIREHVETGITDDALQVLLDDAQAQVEGRFGTDEDITIRLVGGTPMLRLHRPALAITSINESSQDRTPLYTLTNIDYDLIHAGRTLIRLTGGYWGEFSWAPVVDVVYTPKPEQALRDRVVVDLVKLAVQYNALEQESIGSITGYQSRSLDYLRERERLLAGVGASRGFRFA